MTRNVSLASPTTVAPGSERTIQPRNSGESELFVLFCTERKIAVSGSWSDGRVTQDCTLTWRSPTFAWLPTGMEIWLAPPSTLLSTPSTAVFPGTQVFGTVGAVSGGAGGAAAVVGAVPAGAGGTGVCTRPGGGAGKVGVAGAGGAARGADTMGGAGGTTTGFCACAHASEPANNVRKTAGKTRIT